MTAGLDCVVVNYHTSTDLAEFLASYDAYGCEYPGELTVVNVAPFIADRQVAQQWGGLIDHYIAFEENVGYARACNRGAQQGDGDVVALFNADTILSAHVLSDCYDAILREPTWGVLGPRQVDQLGRITSGGVYGHPTRPHMESWMVSDGGQCSEIREDALTVAGSAYFVRREVWEELSCCPLYLRAAPDAEGAFLPTRHYYEETWCSYHARAHGFQVVFYGPACMIHKWHRASALGGHADQGMSDARALFRRACDLHGRIPHE